MGYKSNLVSEETIAAFHPSLQDSVRAVNSPEVQEIMRQLGKYGLAVTLPHMHNEEGMVPLPEDMMSCEDNLQVTFKKWSEEQEGSGALPVTWRRGTEIHSIARCAENCGGCC